MYKQKQFSSSLLLFAVVCAAYAPVTSFAADVDGKGERGQLADRISKSIIESSVKCSVKFTSSHFDSSEETDQPIQQNWQYSFRGINFMRNAPIPLKESGQYPPSYFFNRNAPKARVSITSEKAFDTITIDWNGGRRAELGMPRMGGMSGMPPSEIEESGTDTYILTSTDSQLISARATYNSSRLVQSENSHVITNHLRIECGSK